MRAIFCVALTIISCLIGSVQSLADEPQSQEDRQKLLVERDRLANEAQGFMNQGQLDESVSRLERVLELEKQIFGPTHEEVLGTWSLLERVHEARNDFAK